ncbi:hypothetical protein [Cecembia lonarensis]|uniref:Uncharacterized protein n=1 Tax=Cecembia lonarensis (strain CCUG 58316 / KCTC 22772 / LW9) TaxID=1225176 RepID=K1L1R0_CECL9|nr:hypothetical protein [Cecembia lonarensis]EKB48701.1 hypothetical protein B879_02660 [Cecembia lonarensis LW9]
MAKQTGIITLNGNVGRLNFYKNRDGYQARERGGIPRSRIMTDPRFARTRENIAEFRNNAAAVKLLKDTIRPATVRISDSRLHQRMVRRLLEILRTDPVNVRGERQVFAGDWSLIDGLEMNAQASLTSVLRTEISLTDTPAAWGISIQPFQPSDFLLVPEGATHFRVFIAGASVNFETGDRSFVQENTAELPVLAQAATIELQIDKTNIAEPHKVLLVGVEFLQMVNGLQYNINNGINNAAAILRSENS